MINKICAILIDSNVVVSVFKNKQWPSQSNVESNKNTFYKTIYVRPTVKLQQKANKILENDMDWINRTIDIKQLDQRVLEHMLKALTSADNMIYLDFIKLLTP